MQGHFKVIGNLTVQRSANDYTFLIHWNSASCSVSDNQTSCHYGSHLSSKLRYVFMHNVMWNDLWNVSNITKTIISNLTTIHNHKRYMHSLWEIDLQEAYSSRYTVCRSLNVIILAVVRWRTCKILLTFDSNHGCSIHISPFPSCFRISNYMTWDSIGWRWTVCSSRHDR